MRPFGWRRLQGVQDLSRPVAENLIRDLEADGRVDEAEEYSRLAGTLLREIGS